MSQRAGIKCDGMEEYEWDAQISMASSKCVETKLASDIMMLGDDDDADRKNGPCDTMRVKKIVNASCQCRLSDSFKRFLNFS